MSHPIIEDLNFRYTAKKYDANKRISAEDVAVITETLRLSASSINSQPWKFIVLESEAAKQRFHDTFANMHQFNQPHATEASHIVLFAHNPNYTKDDYRKVIDEELKLGRLNQDSYQARLDGAFGFVEMVTDDSGYNGQWTKAQTYIALGTTLHTLARLKIDSTPMEGVDPELIGEEFKGELGGYVCNFALAMGYHLEGEDYNQGLPKSRLPIDEVIVTL
ncbi:NAD(P)H-dependent oxidoreductase [Shewanella maritima]|uniref:NAD(P)H-dependent oxidoreductase n=1 Tax=Shewanella maritima TaxID=2520507 RepID=A0A411PJR8_9GAMM|nr:nitroreductase family protein [Shewanella maritima]QBF83827.1 NAD(P)H-dependent oxidoreductase [Shewanella maritima]